MALKSSIIARLKQRVNRVRHIEQTQAALPVSAAQFVDSLFKGENQQAAWKEFLNAFVDNCDELTAALERNLEGDDLINMLGTLLIPAGRIGFRDGEIWVRLFDAAERMGIHFLPVGYYSPVPDCRALGDEVFESRFDDAFAASTAPQLDLLWKAAVFAREMESTPQRSSDARPDQYDWSNDVFNPIDASIYHSLIRHFRPSHIIEVGCGYSTLVALNAVKLNGGGKVTCIEPYPPEFLRGQAHRLAAMHGVPVQNVPLEIFDALGPDDILFVDSTHVSRIGSDVNFLILKVLPRLKPGVVIHFHDIFLPFEYPRDWIINKKIFWNEQYLLLAFLMFNQEFEVLLSNRLVLGRHGKEMREALAFLTDENWRGASSLWLRRRRLVID